MSRAVAVALLAAWFAGCGTPRPAPAGPAADPRAAFELPPRADDADGQPEERHRRVRGAADAIDLSDFGLDPDRPRPAEPAPPVISADERATLDAIEAIARLFAQGLPPAELYRRLGRNPTSIDGDITLVPHAAPLASIIASSTTHQLTLRLRSAIAPAILETRFGPFGPCCFDDRESPSFSVILDGASDPSRVLLEVSYSEAVGADWRDDPIHEVHLFRSPARRERSRRRASWRPRPAASTARARRRR